MVDSHAGQVTSERAAAAKPPRRVRVLFVTHSNAFGGSEKHLLDLVQSLDRARFHSAIVCVKKDVYSKRLAPELGVDVISALDLSSVGSWWRLFLRTKPDVVVFEHGYSFAFSWQAYLAAKIAGVHNICCVQHSIAPPLLPAVKCDSLRNLARRLFGWRTRHVCAVKLAAALCTRIICVSEAIRKKLIQEYGYPAAKMVTIYNGVNLAEYSARQIDRDPVREGLKVTSQDVVVVCVARLSREKGIDVLLDAMAQLCCKDHAIKTIIVGDGPLGDQLAEQARELGLASAVHFVGFQADVRTYLQASDIFVLTSYKEGLPFSVLEAMACGLPCVVTDVGGNSEAVGAGEGGVVVKPGSADEVAGALRELLVDREKRAAMSQKARARACRLFNLEVALERMKSTILEGAL